MTSSKRKFTLAHKKFYLSALAVVIVAAAAFGTIRLRHNDSTDTNQTKVTGTLKDGSPVNLSPPTEADKQAVDQHKEDLGNQEDKPSTPASNDKQDVTPNITYAGQNGTQQIEVRGFVPGVIEDGGTCTANFELNGATVSKQSIGFKDATVTLCTKFTIPRSEFSPGTWMLTLSYTSADHQGSSTAMPVKVE